MKRCRFWFDGYFDYLRGHARRRGIPLSTLDCRVKSYGNRPENYERLLHIGPLGSTYQVANGHGDSVTQHAIRAGLSPSTVFSRIQSGASLEDALRPSDPLHGYRTIPKVRPPEDAQPKVGKLPKWFWYGGRYDSMTGHARRRGIANGTASERARRYGRRFENLDRILFPGRLRNDYFEEQLAEARAETERLTEAELPDTPPVIGRRSRYADARKRRELASLGLFI